MPKFDLEQIATKLCEDRAFGNLALNELMWRLSNLG